MVHSCPAAPTLALRANRDTQSMFRNPSSAQFEQMFLPHLDAAYNLARVLMRNAQDAEDAVQEAYLRAFRSFGGFRGDTARPWLLTIVRNTCFTLLQQNRGRGQTDLDSDRLPAPIRSPEAEALDREQSAGLQRCIGELPEDFREAIVLREMEELSYREIAEITGVPQGTVMSRLARARARLAECLKRRASR